MSLEQLSDKIEKLTEEIHDVKVVLAQNAMAEANHQKNIERFWNSTWPDTIKAIENNKLKLAKHEVLLARINTKLTVFGSTVGFAIPFLIYYLRRYGAH